MLGLPMGTEHYITDLTLWWVFTTWMAKSAAMGVCPMGFFGFLCQYQCHCQYGAACDSISGSCFGECEIGWTGKPTCQIQNVAYGQRTHQEGSVLDTSGLAVDGNIDQDGSKQTCTWSFNRFNPYLTQWLVDLGHTYSVNNIQIYFRNDEVRNLQRRAGMSVYLSPTEDFRDGERCYFNDIKDKNFAFPPELLVLKNCTARGRFVILINQRPWSDDPSQCPSTLYSCWAHLEICEVEVYTCTHGTYGPKCDKFCHCESGTTCNQRTGECPFKCQAGWTGKRCDHECPKSRFGKDCRQICGLCKGGKDCDKVSGKCAIGCEAGWVGEMCIETCPDGTYGVNCTKLCGQCADWSDCDSVTGECPVGCQAGWYRERCDKKCEAGKYGEKCDKVCGSCKDGAPCSQVNGECSRGCTHGFNPPFCVEKCQVGFYGEECIGRCGNCKDNATCDHVTGNCSTGCEIGWTGVRCQERCKRGTYGRNCAKTCTTCLKEDCDHVTGKCSKGCESGWLPPMCNEACKPGFYGHDCVHTCGTCAHFESCDHVIGTCRYGCAAGWTGQFCKTPCPAGTYGTQCHMSCGHCLNNTVCNHVDGACLAGCAEGYEGLYCLKVLQTERMEADNTSTTGGIVGGALGFVGIVGVIVLACVVRHWRRGNKNGKRQSVSETNEEGMYENANVNNAYESIEEVQESNLRTSTSESTLYANTYYNMGKQSRGIPVVMLEDYINRLDDTPDGFQDQFEELRNCPTLPHVHGQKPENKNKNRFLTTFPYDHSRVILDEIPGEPCSDYINANYIDSVDTEKAYIATQGPNRTTIRDFWRMVWQEKVGKIVMLANVIEHGKVKCEKYWPEKEPVEYCDILVTPVSMIDLAKYTIRNLTLKNTKSKEIRQIIQFHFTGWPDHGVPDTLELVTFLKRVNSVSSNLAGPLLVHCSAGVGRTGTFIGLDALFKYGSKAKRLDILNYVKRMRDNRMTMVQNVEQFVLLHTALLEVFSFRNSVIKKLDFLDVYKELCSEESCTFREEFQCLESTKPKYTNTHCSSALLKENVDKNRNLEVLPVDCYRPFLNTYIPGTNDYISAVIIPSLGAEGKSIITQYPLSNTVVDFWRLTFDQDCQTIVSLNLLDEDQEDSTGAWWPSEGESVTYGPLVITTTSTFDNGNGISEKLYTLSKKDYGETRVIKSFHLSTWPVGHNVPNPTDSILSLMEMVDGWKMECGNDSIIVQCMDGALCSGLYSTVSLVLERLRLEEEVDVYHAVRRLQIRRPQFICNLEQYRYIYEVISRHLETSVLYGNV